MKPARHVYPQAGVTVIELVAALAVFALLFLIVDAVFFAANRGAKKAELAADVQQNARIAMERLIREVRESAPSELQSSGTYLNTTIRVDTTTGQAAIVFKSARLGTDNSVFCLYARSTANPSYFYNTNCFYGGVSGPTYTSTQLQADKRLGSYTPLWQRYVAYFLENGELRRKTGNLSTPSETLPDPAGLSGGDVIATFIESFDVSPLTGSKVAIVLKARGQSVVQGSAVPAQEILLDGTVLVRN